MENKPLVHKRHRVHREGKVIFTTFCGAVSEIHKSFFRDVTCPDCRRFAPAVMPKKKKGRKPGIPNKPKPVILIDHSQIDINKFLKWKEENFK